MRVLAPEPFWQASHSHCPVSLAAVFLLKRSRSSDRAFATLPVLLALVEVAAETVFSMTAFAVPPMPTIKVERHGDIFYDIARPMERFCPSY